MHQDSRRTPLVLNRCAAAIAAAFALHPQAGLAQQIVTDGRTATSLSISGSVTDIATGSVHGANAFNSFSRFDVYSGNTVNLIVPEAASNLINLVSGEASRIDGMLNAVKGGNIGGNVFFLNPHGIIVGRDGMINAGSLTLITPAQSFMDAILDARGVPDAASTARLLEGHVPINSAGLIFVQGTINAEGGVKLAGGSVQIPGVVQSGAVFQHSKVAFSDVVNVAGMQNANEIRVVNGIVEIVATQDVAITGTVASEGANGLAGGTVKVRAGGGLGLGEAAVVSVRGRGSNSAGGTLDLFAEGSARLADQAKLDARGGEVSGDGGFVELSARDTVTIAGGLVDTSATAGSHGTFLVDPLHIVINTNSTTAFFTGGNGVFEATDSIEIGPGVIVSSRQIADMDDFSVAGHPSAPSTADSGSLIFRAPQIRVRAGAQVLAQGGNGFAGGDISFLATLANGGDAGILLDNAVVKGRSITATASVLNDTTGLLVETTSQSGRITVEGGVLEASGGDITLTSSSTLNAASQAHIPLGVVTATSIAETIVRGDTRVTTTNLGRVALAATSTVTATAISDSPLAGELAGDAAVAVTDVTSTARALLSGNATVDAGGRIGITATNTVTSVATADAAASGSSAAGATVAVGKLRATTRAAVEENAEIIDAAGIDLLAGTTASAKTQAVAAASGAAEDTSKLGRAARTLDEYKGQAKTNDGGVTVAASVGVNDVISTTQAILESSRLANTSGTVTLGSSSIVTSTVLADGSSAGGGVGVGAGVAVNIAKVTNQAHVTQAVSAEGLAAAATMGTDADGGNVSTFRAEARSGAGATNVGVAGSLAVNVTDQRATALLAGNGGLTLAGGAFGLTAENRAANTAQATPTGPATGSTVGIGASVAIDVVTNRATAEVSDGRRVTGAGSIDLSATGAYAMLTEAEAGAAGGIAVTPVLALSVSDNATRATLGTGGVLILDGDLTLLASHTSTITTTAKADAAGDKAAVGASIAIAIVNDTAAATTNRDIDTTGSVRFRAHSASASNTSAKASATGGAGEEDDGSTPSDGIDQQIGAQANFGKSQQAAGSANSGQTPGQARNSSGSVSVAGAVAVNVSESEARATVPDGRTIKADGQLEISASNNTDATAAADGSAAGSGSGSIGIGAAVAINTAKSVNEARLGVADHSADGALIRATMTDDGDADDATRSVSGAEAKSGGGGGKVGIAGSLAVNVIDTSSTATIASGASLEANGGEVTIEAANTTATHARALPSNGIATGSSLGVGASFAIDVVSNKSVAEIEDTAALTGAGRLELRATGDHEITTEAEAGAASASIAVTPVLALSVVDNQTRARIGTPAGGNAIEVGGDIVVSATHRGATITTAKAEAAGAKAGIGASIAIGIVNDSAIATTARDIVADGGVEFEAVSASASMTAAQASASGAQEDEGDQPSDGVDQQINQEANYGKSQQASGSANSAQTPGSARTSSGGISVAAAIGVNVSNSAARAFVPDAIDVTAKGGALKLSASNNTDAFAGADASSVGRGFNATTGQGSKLGIGAGVAVNVANATTEASLGVANHNAQGVELSATMTDDGNADDATRSVFGAESSSGAGSAKIGIAGSVGINVVDNRATAAIREGAQVDASGGDPAFKGDVKLTSENRSLSTAKALKAGDGAAGTDVGVGASFAVNVANNRSTAEIEDDARVTNAAGVHVSATGDHEMLTAAEAGSAGRISVTPVVAVSVAQNVTIARIGKLDGEALVTTGNVRVEATHRGSTTTTADADAAGAKAAIGAAIAVTVAEDKAQATTARHIVSDGGITFSAHAQGGSSTNATGSAAGGQEDDNDDPANDQPDDGVDQQAQQERSFAENQRPADSNSQAGSTSSPSAQTSAGGVSVGAAIAVNVGLSEARAFVPDDITVNATGGGLALSASNNTDAFAGADGSAAGKPAKVPGAQPPTKVGVGVGVAVNYAKSVNEASLGRGQHSGQGVSLEALMTQDAAGDDTSRFGAEAKSGAGSAKIGVAGALGLNIVDHQSHAVIRSGAEVDALGGDVRLSTASKSESTAKALPTPKDTGANTDVGVGASFAVNVVTNRAVSELEGTQRSNGTVTREGAKLANANNATLEAEGDHTMLTEAEAGSAGRISVTPVVAVSVATNETTATLGAGNTLDIGGDLVLSATHAASTTTTAKADAAGAKAAVGASIAITVADDRATATTHRDIVAGKGARFAAHSRAASSASAKASAAGGTEDANDGGAEDQPEDGVDQQATSQRSFAEGQSNSGSTASGAAANPKAATTQGGVSVAAAIGVNVAKSEARAFTPDGVDVTANGGALQLSASNNTDAAAGADASATGRNVPNGTKVGVGAAVAINYAEAKSEATLGVGSHRGNGVTIESLTTDDGSGDADARTSRFGASAISGAGSAKVGVAGALAINIVDHDSRAQIRGSATSPTAQVDAGAGHVRIASAAESASDVLATSRVEPPSIPTTGTSVGVGASIGVNVVTNVSRAQLNADAKLVNADDVTLQATGHHDMTTTAIGGAGGNIAVTPVVAVSVANNRTIAQLEAGETLALGGDFSATATHHASTATTADASASGPKAAIGAAIAVTVANDTATATTGRHIHAQRGATFGATTIAASSADAKASASGGGEDDSSEGGAAPQASVDDQVAEQKNFAEGSQTGEAAGESAQTAKAATSQGGVSVAAAIAVNVSNAKAQAVTPDGVNVVANGGKLSLAAAINADASAVADGSAVGKDLPAPSPTNQSKVGVGAGVAINVAKARADATLGRGTHAGDGVDVSATMADDNADTTSTFLAGATSGAGSAKIGVAGSLAINVVDHRSTALVTSGADVDARGGNVKLEAESRSSSTASAMPDESQGASGTDVGIGASFAINVVANSARAELEGASGGDAGAKLANANDLRIHATGDHRMVTEAAAGAVGGTAVTPVVSVAISENETLARIGDGEALSANGLIELIATHQSVNETSAKGQAQGAKAAIGAAIAVTVANDTAEATTRRDIAHAGGTVKFQATSAASTTTTVEASARGGPADEDDGTANDAPEDGVDQQAAEQQGFGKQVQADNDVGEENGTSPDPASQVPSKAATSEGGVSVAAAIGVNVVNNTAKAFIPASRTVNADGALELVARTNTDSTLKADAEAVGKNLIDAAEGAAGGNTGGATGGESKVGVGAAVVVNVVNATTEATIGRGARVRAAGVSLTAATADVNGDDVNTIAAEASSGSGSAKVSIAGALALNVIDATTKAQIDDTATVDARGFSAATGSNDIAVEAQSVWDVSAAATPSEETGGASGSKVGIGASIALNIFDQTTSARIGNGAVSNARDLDVTATSDTDSEVKARAGAKGGVAIDAVVATTTLTETTEAIVSGTSTIDTTGSTTITATSGGTHTARAEGNVVSGNVGLGASAAVLVSNTTTTAALDRSLNARDDVRVAAASTRAYTGYAQASAKGAVMDAVEQDPTKEDTTTSVKTLKENGDAQQGGGGAKVNIAAAVGVVVLDDDVTARIGNNATVRADDDLAVTATGTSDFRTEGTGAAIDPTSNVGIGIGVAIAVSRNDTTATVADGTRLHVGDDIAVNATTTQNLSSGFRDRLTVEAIAGAGASKAAVAGALAVANSNATTTAYVGATEIRGETDANDRSGDITITADNTSVLSAKAWAGGAAGKAGVGASIATVVSSNEYRAGFGGGSVRASSLDIGALNHLVTGSVPFDLSDFSKLQNVNLQILAGRHNYYTEALAGSAGGTAAVSGAFSVQVYEDVTEAKVGSTAGIDLGGALGLRADSGTRAKAFAGGVAGGGTAGVGVSTATISNETTTRATLAAGADVSRSASITVDANADQDLGAFGISGAVAGSVSVAGTVNVILSENTVEANLGGDGSSIASAGAITVDADNTLTFFNVAGAASASGSLGVGASAATNLVTNTTRAQIGGKAQVDTTGGAVSVTADARENLDIIVIGAAGGGAVGVALSGAVTKVTNVTEALVGPQARVGRSDQLAGAVTIHAQDDTDILDVMGTVGIGGSAGVGAAADVVLVDKRTTAKLGDEASLHAAGNMKIDADSSETLRSIVVGLGGGADVGVAGSVAAVMIDAVTEAVVGRKATAFTRGSMAVDAASDTVVDILAGGGAAGAYAGIGAAVGVVLIDKTTQATVGDEATVDALGLTDMRVATGDIGVTWVARGSDRTDVSAPSMGTDSEVGASTSRALTQKRVATRAERDGFRGLAVTATAHDDVGSIAVAGAASGVVAITLAANVSTTDNHTEAAIGNSARINQGTATPNAAQSVLVGAGQDTFRLGAGGAASGAGFAGAGAGGDISIIANRTRAGVGRGTLLDAAGDVSVTARGREDILTIAGALAVGGTAGLAGSVSVLSIDNTTEAELGDLAVAPLPGAAPIVGARVDAGGSVQVAASNHTQTDMIAGAAAAGVGGGGIGAAVGVLLLDKTTSALVGDDAVVNALGNGSTTFLAYTGEDPNGARDRAVRGLLVDAESTEHVFTFGAAGAAGLYLGFAGAVTVNALESTTTASVGARARINETNTGAHGDQDVVVGARDVLDVTVITGSLGAGAVGVAGAVDVGIVNHRVGAGIGSGAHVHAKRDIDAYALAVKDIDSTVVSAAGGIVGVAAAVSVYSVGGAVDGASRDRLKSDDGGSNANGYADEQASDGTVKGLLDRSASSDIKDIGAASQSRRNAFAVSGRVTATPQTGNAVSIGNTVVLDAGRDIDVDVREHMRFDAIAGGVAVGGVSLGAGVQVANLNLSNRVDVGTVTVTAGRDAAFSAYLDSVGIGKGFAGTGGVVAVDASVSLMDDDAVTVVEIDGMRVLSAGSVTADADDRRRLRAETTGASLGLFTAGASYAEATIDGETKATLSGASRIDRVGNVTARADSTTDAEASAESARGGYGVAASATLATARARPDVEASLGGVIVADGTVASLATAEATADAEARGVNVAAGIGIGASIATAEASPKITGGLAGGSDVTARNIDVLAQQLRTGNANSARANAVAGSGGILAGISATESSTSTAARVEATIGANSRLVIRDGGTFGQTDVNDSANTITFGSRHGFATGDELVYETSGGAVIDGLTAGTKYYVIRISDTVIKLASSRSAALGYNVVTGVGAIDIAKNLASATVPGVTLTDASGSGSSISNTSVIVDGDSGTITFSSNPKLVNGQQVVYRGTGINGLTTGETYYVVLVPGAPNAVRLASSLTSPAPIALTLAQLPGDGTVTGVQLFNASTGTVRSNGTLKVNAADNSLESTTHHNFTTGERVVYQKGTSAGIPGLTDGETYVVAVQDETRFSLQKITATAVDIAAVGGSVGGQNFLGADASGTTLTGAEVTLNKADSTITVTGGHAFKTGDVVRYTGGGINGLSVDQVYVVDKVSDTAFKLKVDSSTYLRFGSGANYSASFRSTTDTPVITDAAVVAGYPNDSASDQIRFASAHGLSTGQSLVYRAPTDVDARIPNLADGQTYVVNVLDAQTIRLTTQLKLDVAAVSLGGENGVVKGVNFLPATLRNMLNATVTVNDAANTIQFAQDHGFAPNEKVLYRGAGITGLSNDANYFAVVVDSRTLRLASALSQSTATLGTPAGTAPVNVSLAGQGSNGTLVSNVVATTDPSYRSIALGAGNTLNFDKAHGFTTGAAVQFSGSGVAGLADDTIYFAVVKDSLTLQLADSLEKATATSNTPQVVAISLPGGDAGSGSYRLTNERAGTSVVAVSDTQQSSATTGVAVSLIFAAGSNDASAFSNTTTSAHLGSGVSIAGGTLAVQSLGSDNNLVDSVAGSGGIVAGSASQVSNTNLSTTTAGLDDSAAGNTKLVDVRVLAVQATHTAAFNSTASSINASLVGASGARIDNLVNATVVARVGSNVNVETLDAVVEARNVTRKPLLTGQYNIESGSGGFLNGAAAQSNTRIINDTRSEMGENARFEIKGDRDQPGALVMSALNDVQAQDRVKLDAGGAIAIALANAKIEYGTDSAPNRARVIVEDGATIDSVGDITLSARTVSVDPADSNAPGILAQSNAKTYGLAGAAAGTTTARLVADNIVDVRGGTLTALNDVNLLAGRNAAGVDNKLNVSARTDLWNKTAFPVVTDPDADSFIIQNNRVLVAGDATLNSVRHVNLVAVDGETVAVGVGIGKDLYREALAEVGSAVSNALGGGDVNLDIKSGSSTVRGNPGVRVDGAVNAGIHHLQFLHVDAAGNVTLSDGVSFRQLDNTTLQRQIQQRIVTLNQLISQYSADAAVKGAFEAEKSFLETKLATLGNDIQVSFLQVDDILARSGNIDVTGKWFAGRGALSAPGDVKIEITNFSEKFLRLGKLTIPDDAGGNVYFNGVPVGLNADVNQRQAPGAVADFTTIDTTLAPSAPQILIDNRFQGARTPQGAILVPDSEVHMTGDVLNAFGPVSVSSVGTIIAGAKIEGQTVILRTDGDFIQQYVWGFQHTGNSPRGLLDSIARGNETTYGIVRLGGSGSPLKSSNTDGPVTSTQPFSVRASDIGSTIVGNNVFIAADKLNINGLIQSGIPLRAIKIDSTLTKNIPNLPATGKFALNTPAGGSGDIRVYWNATDGVIEVDPVTVRGGYLEVYGNIFSTGNGKLRAIDGYGRISIDNTTDYTVRLSRLDTGVGAAGTIRISDTARMVNDAPTVTTLSRLGNLIQRDVATALTNGDIEHNVTVITDTKVANDNGMTTWSTTYQPLPNRLYSWVTGRNATFVETETYRKKVDGVFGWDALAPDPGQQPTVYGATTKQPVALLQGEFLEVGTLPEGEYRFVYQAKKTGPKTQFGQPTENSWGSDCTASGTAIEVCWSTTTDKTWTYNTPVSQVYKHSVSASVPIAVEFFGFAQGIVNVTSAGSVQIGETINNANGVTTISSTAGSVQVTGTAATLFSQRFDLNGATGIGSATQALRTSFRDVVDAGGDVTQSAILKATSNTGNIFIEHGEGQVRVERLASTSGNVSLLADAGILALNASTLVKGGRVELISANGAVGSLTMALDLDVGRSRSSDGLTIVAAGDIAVRQRAGDLWLDKAVSRGGDVAITVVDGGIVDVNPVETVDQRTRSDLLNLWNQMRLIGDAKTLADPTIKGFERAKEREYRTYWEEVRQVRSSTVSDGQGGTITTYTHTAFDPDQPFTLRAAERSYYLDTLQWTEAQVAQLELDRAREYGTGTYDPNYRFTYDTSNDPSQLTKGASWTEAELRLSLSAGALKETTDTNVRLEDPSISGRNVSISVTNGSVGVQGLGRETVIELAGGPAAIIALTDEQILALAAAERRDITVVGTRITVANPDDVNIDATGAISITVDRTRSGGNTDVYLGSTGDLRLATIDTDGALRVKAKGGISHTDAAGNAIIGASLKSGDDMILEAARGALGTVANPIVVTMTGGHLTARAQDGMVLRSTGNVSVDALYTPQEIRLSADGTIREAFADDLLDVRAKSVFLTARGSIGAGGSTGGARNALDVAVDEQVGAIEVESTEGSVFLNNPTGEIRFGRIVAADTVGLSAVLDLNVADTVTGRNGVALEAGDRLTLESGSVVTTESGTLLLTGRHEVLVEDGASVEAGLAGIVVGTDGNALLTALSTANAGPDAVRIAAGGRVLSSGDSVADITAGSAGAVVTILGAQGIGNGTVTANGVTDDIAPLALHVAAAALDGGTGSVHVTNAGDLAIASARADGDIEASAGGALRADVIDGDGTVRLSSLGDVEVGTVTGRLGVDVSAAGDLRVRDRVESAEGDLTLDALTITDPIGELRGRTVNVRAALGDIEITKLTFETANLTAAEEGARLHVLTAIAQASRIVARADVIALDNVTSLGTNTLFFDLAGNDGGLALSTDVNALPGMSAMAGITGPGFVQFDRLFSEEASIRSGIPNLRLMETLIGRQATFANHSVTYGQAFNVKLDNQLATLSPGFDALIASKTPFYLYFQDGKVIETNANVIYGNPAFELRGSDGSLINSSGETLEQALKRRIDPAAPAGRVTLTIPGNVLGRNASAIDGEGDIRITLPARPSVGLRR